MLCSLRYVILMNQPLVSIMEEFLTTQTELLQKQLN